MSELTWYDILDVLPGASAAEIRWACQVKLGLVGPDAISGASSQVVKAAARGRSLIEAAWHVLGDPGSRRRYDGRIGLQDQGAGLEPPQPVPSEPDWQPWGNAQVLEAEAALAALADWLSPHPGPSRRVVVPDVRGLFVGTCRRAIGGGLRMETVLLTPHPMPVEGLVVGQSPGPGVKAHRFSTLTVQVWHPPRRPG